MKRVWLYLGLFIILINIAAAQVCFSGPQGIAKDSSGNIYISDTANNRILKRDSGGTVSVFAGSAVGTAGFNPGNSGSAVGTAATFNQPHKIMVDPTGTYLYVADTGNNAIRKIALSSGTVTTVAGKGPTTSGAINGNLNTATFSSPKGLFITTLGEIVVADTGNNKLRLVNEGAGNDAVSDFAGQGFGGVSCTSTNPGACPSNVACGSMPLNAPEDVVISTTTLAGPNPTHYYETLVADTGNNGIWAVRYARSNNAGVAFSCVGSWIAGRGTQGYNTGGTQVVEFDQPSAIDAVNYDSSGSPIVNTYTSPQTFFVVDRGNHVLRYTHTDGTGSNPATSYTVAGSPQVAGFTDGSAIFPTNALVAPAGTPISQFNTPTDILVKANNNFEYSGSYSFLVLESSNKLRQLTDSAPTTANGVWNVNTLMTCGGGGVTPVTCASADDIILRLDAPTNAHGQKYDQTPAYPVEICYSSIFGTAAPTNPSRACTGSGNGNRVVRLSSPTNAHAEIPDASSPSYTTEVCYQGLTCHSVAGNVGCSTNNPVEYEVLQLSGATNAHLETASGTAFTTASDKKICCSNYVNPTVSINNARWLHYDGTPFGLNEYACVGQWVRAATDVTGTSSVYTDLGEADCLAGSPPCPLDYPFVLDLPTPVGVGGINLPFQITTDMIASSSSNEANPEREFYFITKNTPGLPPVNPFSISPILNVWPESNQCQFPPPIAVITAPVHQGVYFANTLINFVPSCTSAAGPLTYSWEIIQGGSQIHTSTLETFQYQFANTGQALVRLTCTDIALQSATAENQILVVASPFVFAYINQPALNDIIYNQIPSSGPYFATEVDFSASDSFAVDTNIPSACTSSSPCGPTSPNPCTVTCIAGNCPTATQNSPQSCIGNDPNSPTNGAQGGGLLISGAPSSPGNANYQQMNFDWTFWDNNFNEPWTQFEGAGVFTGTAVYDDLSNTINDKHMSVAAGVQGASATFEREFTLGRCLNSGNTFLNLNGQQLSTISVPGACRGLDLNSPLDNCCPNGLVCEGSSGGELCAIPSNPVNTCSDMNQQQCNNWANINPQAPYNQVPNPPACTYLECLWNPNANNGAGACGVHEIPYTPGPGGCTPPPCVNSDCTWSTDSTNCENGQKTISYQGTPVSNPTIPICPGQTNSCTRPSVTVPCGSLNFELGFFDYVQFIAAAIVIALIYLALGMRKKIHE